MGAFVNFDMETYQLRNLTLALFRATGEEDEFRERPAVGIALQAYLRDTEDDLRGLIAWARSRDRPIGVRLVKDAYWDYETVVAQPRAWQASLSPELKTSGGDYVPPTVFVGCRPEHVIVREEIFGPVLAILRAKDLDEALALANRTDYALTGGLFSRSPGALERARQELQVGNLYLNRGITGAIVERHPFGGFKMSGGGTKAGGRGYLENFLFPRVIAENVLRRGFTPPEDAAADG